MKTQIDRAGMRAGAAFWRGDMVVVLAILISWAAMIIVTAFALGSRGAIAWWSGMVAVLVVSWAVSVGLLVQRTAVSDRDMAGRTAGNADAER